jgi:hypothetical protein
MIPIRSPTSVISLYWINPLALPVLQTLYSKIELNIFPSPVCTVSVLPYWDINTKHLFLVFWLNIHFYSYSHLFCTRQLLCFSYVPLHVLLNKLLEEGTIFISILQKWEFWEMESRAWSQDVPKPNMSEDLVWKTQDRVFLYCLLSIIHSLPWLLTWLCQFYLSSIHFKLYF